MSNRMLVQGIKMPILVDESKPFFWESKTNVKTFQKLSSYIWGLYKFVLKSINSLNWILLATKYWFKALKWQIWLTNTKQFFWLNEENFENLHNFTSYIWVSYKFVSKSVTSLNRLFLATEYWFKVLKCQIWLTNTKSFLGKARQT